MPNKRSAYKHLRADPKKQLRNKMIKSSVKTALKKAEQAIASGDIEAAKAAFQEAVSKLDRAVDKGVIKRGTADRKKSKLAQKLNRLISEAA